jgi:S-adenosylmethionine/arginine decarboxylase-like enzyme
MRFMPKTIKIRARREGDLNALGKHLLLELKDCNREVLNNLSFLQNALVSAAEEAGATVLGKYFSPIRSPGREWRSSYC